MLTTKDIVLYSGNISVTTRLLIGYFAASGGVSRTVTELVSIKGWSTSKIRRALAEAQIKGLVTSYDLHSFDPGRPELAYRLSFNAEQPDAGRCALGSNLAVELLSGRCGAPKRDLDCFVFVTLWFGATTNVLASVDLGLMEALGFSQQRVRRALRRLLKGGWIYPSGDDGDVPSTAVHYLLSIDKFNSVIRQQVFRLPAAAVNILAPGEWVKLYENIPPGVAILLASYSSWLFVTLFNEGIIGTDRFKTWVEKARSCDDSCDDPYVTYTLQSFSEITGCPICWSSYLNLFSSLNVSAELIRREGGERLNLAMAENDRVNRFSLVTINQRYA